MLKYDIKTGSIKEEEKGKSMRFVTQIGCLMKRGNKKTNKDS